MRRESDGERRRGRAEGRTYRELFMHATVADRYEERETCGMVWQATDREETHIAPPIRQHLILRLVPILATLHITSTSSNPFSPYNSH